MRRVTLKFPITKLCAYLIMTYCIATSRCALQKIVRISFAALQSNG